MNKKILAVSILAVLMLVTISFASAINTTPAKKKESPLFGIRTKLAIGEKSSQIFKNIKTKFLGERIFWIPLRWINNVRDHLLIETQQPTTSVCPITCGKYSTCYQC